MVEEPKPAAAPASQERESARRGPPPIPSRRVVEIVTAFVTAFVIAIVAAYLGGCMAADAAREATEQSFANERALQQEERDRQARVAVRLLEDDFRDRQQVFSDVLNVNLGPSEKLEDLEYCLLDGPLGSVECGGREGEAGQDPREIGEWYLRESPLQPIVISDADRRALAGSRLQSDVDRRYLAFAIREWNSFVHKNPVLKREVETGMVLPPDQQRALLALYLGLAAIHARQ